MSPRSPGRPVLPSPAELLEPFALLPLLAPFIFLKASLGTSALGLGAGGVGAGGAVVLFLLVTFSGLGSRFLGGSFGCSTGFSGCLISGASSSSWVAISCVEAASCVGAGSFCGAVGGAGAGGRGGGGGGGGRRSSTRS